MHIVEDDELLIHCGWSVWICGFIYSTNLSHALVFIHLTLSNLYEIIYFIYIKFVTCRMIQDSQILRYFFTFITYYKLSNNKMPNIIK